MGFGRASLMLAVVLSACTLLTDLEGLDSRTPTPLSDEGGPPPNSSDGGGGELDAPTDQADADPVLPQEDAGENLHRIRGSIEGLGGSLTLQLNGGETLVVNKDGFFAFPTPLPRGVQFTVTIKTQPAFPPRSQTCQLRNASGIVDTSTASNVRVSCTTNKFTVSGSVTGLSGTLVLENSIGEANEQLTSSGSFNFEGIASGDPFAIRVRAHPANQHCKVAPAGIGTMGGANVTNVAVTCTTATILLQESFDTANPGGLPVGWTTTNLRPSSSTALFDIVTTEADTTPKSIFIPGAAVITDVALDSPAFTVTSNQARLRFRQRLRVEDNRDLAVIEIAIGTDPFKDIIQAGGGFAVGGYSIQSLGDNENPLEGRAGWSRFGPTTGFGGTELDLPPAAAGKSVRLRWRLATDEDTGDAGWWIDTVSVIE